MLGNTSEFTMDTLSREAWTGKYNWDHLDGKNVLVYEDEETDPLRIADPSWKNMENICPIIREAWYKKIRGKATVRFGMNTTFRIVAGPDLLAERKGAKK